MAPAFYLKGCMLSFQTLGPYLGDKRVLLDIWVYLSLGVSRDITGCGAECGKPHTAYPSVTIFFLSFFFFWFLGVHLRLMEVPRLGVGSEVQLLAYITATATQDPSHI